MQSISKLAMQSVAGMRPGSEWEEHLMVLEAVGSELLQPLLLEFETHRADYNTAEPVRVCVRGRPPRLGDRHPGQPHSSGPQQEALTL